jgi:hypothetical protein
LSAKRQADNEQILRELNQQFNKDYMRDALFLKAELITRVGKVWTIGTVTTGPGYTEPPLPTIPLLLEYGDTGGINPFKDVAEYLENLAGRLH